MTLNDKERQDAEDNINKLRVEWQLKNYLKAERGENAPFDTPQNRKPQ